MERKKLIGLAYKVLKEKVSYWKQDNTCVKYDLKMEDDSLYLFPKDKEENTFYWGDNVYEVCKGLGLSYVISSGREKYGKVCARIF